MVEDLFGVGEPELCRIHHVPLKEDIAGEPYCPVCDFLECERLQREGEE